MTSGHLRIAILPTGPFSVSLTSSGEVTIIDGFEVGLLQMLTRGLRMPYTLHVPPDGTWGAPSATNGNWSGLIGMVQRNQVDMAIGSIFVSEARMSVVSFSYPYTWQDITFATRMPAVHPKGMAFTWPFECSVWISLGVTIIGC
ncbi:hypothetical protein JTE90_008784 [Oedothorax gibbosus]|uniref:Ionotropic glutamate receptor L-glutamate and glycine-binding domain-containing protein n=1 Tax=Oedothorax gibbosus TaxID=931172 RepID=A0AAV6V726_9ARAC|nr:hypothetical protein JTE90_008784 [Oedothorax gibbosus]